MTGSWSNVVRIERAEEENKQEGKKWQGSHCVCTMRNGHYNHSRHTHDDRLRLISSPHVRSSRVVFGFVESLVIIIINDQRFSLGLTLRLSVSLSANSEGLNTQCWLAIANEREFKDAEKPQKGF